MVGLVLQVVQREKGAAAAAHADDAIEQFCSAPVEVGERGVYREGGGFEVIDEKRKEGIGGKG